MDNEPEEVIKHQMLETRASLAEKLETLEQQVVGTVQSATTAVTDTVESVKDAVQHTVEMARESVHDTVEAVKETFDVTRQVREHPWVMVGGSVALGFAGGCLLHRAGSTGRAAPPGGIPSLSTISPGAGPERDGGLGYRPVEEAPSARAASAPSAAPARHGFLDDLAQKFESEINKLKGLALGTMLGVVRDMVTSSAPPQLSSQLAEVIDSATVKLGGQPIRGSVLNMFQHGFAGQGEGRQSGSPAEGSPRGATHRQAANAAGIVD